MSDAPATEFDVWGSRGSRNLPAGRSRIASRTSCYSILAGDSLYTFDAGRGLVELGEAMRTSARFAAVRRARVLLSHAHLDHWEGLKDVEWFWRRGNALDVEIVGSAEALATMRRAFDEPSYVPLAILARGTVARLALRTVAAGDVVDLGGARVEAFALHHYSGDAGVHTSLESLGFRLECPDGASLAYLCDHEPTPATAERERAVLAASRLAVIDAHFVDARDHAYGHGSQEHAAALARRHPDTLVLAGHHGANLDDDAVRAGFARHAAGLANAHLAVEGDTWRWDRDARAFTLLAAPR